MSLVESDVSSFQIFLELLNEVIACIFSDLQKDFRGKCVVENWFKGILKANGERSSNSKWPRSYGFRKMLSNKLLCLITHNTVVASAGQGNSFPEFQTFTNADWKSWAMKSYIATIPKIWPHLLRGLSQALLFPNKLHRLCCPPSAATLPCWEQHKLRQ